MERKLIIEVTNGKVEKTFIDEKGNKTSEKWVIEGGNFICNEGDIQSQLDQYGNYEDVELLEALDDGDLLIISEAL